jgi:hypothetical protein
MQRISKRRCAGEFRAEAVKLVVEPGVGLAEAARRLAWSLLPAGKNLSRRRFAPATRPNPHRVRPTAVSRIVAHAIEPRVEISPAPMFIVGALQAAEPDFGAALRTARQSNVVGEGYA